MNVAVLGASSKPDRYSFKAIKTLHEKGHTPLPIHPLLKEIDGIPVHRSLGEVAEPIDTISVYLSARNSDPVADSILASRPRRVIFNPGAENPDLQRRLQEQGSEVLEACTIVMLKTGQF